MNYAYINGEKRVREMRGSLGKYEGINFILPGKYVCRSWKREIINIGSRYN